MIKDDLVLGSKVKDVITEFEGVATGIIEYVSGCTQVLVQPKVDKDGKKVDPEWFDIQRLTLIGNEVIILDNYLTPGFDKEPPKR